MTLSLFFLAALALHADGPGRLESKYTGSDFELTADPNTVQWKGVKPIYAYNDRYGKPVPGHRTELRSRWTKDFLYILYVCPYEKLYLKPNPTTTEETNKLWDWDVAEAFIGADFENIAQYREYQVSPQSEWVDLDIDVVNPKPNGGMGWNSGFEVKARIDAAKKVWYGEMRIPLQSIAAKQWRAGDRARLGLFRITGAAGEQRLVSWQPPFRRNFHVPEAFGVLELTQ